MSNLVGQRLGQYEILALLGEGGMAAVYRARQSSMKREVAIKVIKSNLLEMGDFVQRFEREAETIAALSHAHILKVFDYGQQDDVVYLVMELLRGGSLSDKIRREGSLPLSTVDKVLEQIASALDYAHQKGIVHRDLKPQNVLFDEAGHAFLTDFGIAKLLTETTVFTQTGMAMGTPSYMAPEQWQGQPIDSRADVYALGVMLFEMLSGKTPFQGDTPFALMHQHVYNPPPAVSTLRTGLPDSIEPVIRKALAKDRDQRFQTAQDMTNAFKAGMTGQSPASLETASGDSRSTVPVPADFDSDQSTLVSILPAKPSPKRTGLLVFGLLVIVAILAVAGVLFKVGSNVSTLTPAFSNTPLIALIPTQITNAHAEPTPTLILATATITPNLETLAGATFAARAITGTVIKQATDIQNTLDAIVGGTDSALGATATANAVASFTSTPTDVPFLPSQDMITPTLPRITVTFIVSTPSPHQVISNICPGIPSRFAIGMSGRTRRQPTTHLRTGPTQNYDVIQELAPGILFTVVDGPTCGTVAPWWQIRLDDGTTGWVEEGFPESSGPDYYIEPVTS